MADDNEREVARLFRVARTAHELVRDRVRRALCLLQDSVELLRVRALTLVPCTAAQGFAISEDEIKMSLDDFKAQYAAGSNAIECVHSLRAL